jgi:hypothetical protein
MTRTGLVAVLLVVGLLSTQAMGSATLYLSTTNLGAGTPTPDNPNVTINQGDSVTLYLWARLASAGTTIMGINYVASSPAVINPTAVTVENPMTANPADVDPQDPTTQTFRWNGYNVVVNPQPAGFAAAGGFNDPQGVNSPVGLSTTGSSFDPTRVGAAAPFDFLVGSVTFQGVAGGQTDIFMTVGHSLISGTSGFIGTVAAPVLHFGTGDNPLPVSTSGGTNYIAEGVASTVADAHITVLVPEPATMGLLALGGLALARRR